MDQAASLSAADAPAPTLSERLLDELARETQVAAFDDRLFDMGGDLGPRLTAIVDAVRAADADVMMRRQGAWFALLGADLEARVRFALARKTARDVLDGAAVAATATEARVQMLDAALETVQADDARLGAMAARATAMRRGFAAPVSREAKDMLDRFDRRVGNLGSVRAASALILAQIPVALAHHRRLLDRYYDVKTTLFPVWERHVVTVLQSPRDTQAQSALHKAAKALTDRLAERAS